MSERDGISAVARSAAGGAAEAARTGSSAGDLSGGMLYICPTPLGNLGDITQRTLDALGAADVVCAEDTRVTGKLLAAFGLKKRLERLDENMMGQRADDIVERVLAGQVIAYCSDAGMPGVSDPGLRLVRAARQAGAPVCVLPGPTAGATAYVTSGCTDVNFYFGGFLPRKAAEQERLLKSLASLPAALIFYESPNRVVGALESIARVFPLREAAVCRELTKIHEEVVRAETPALHAEFARRQSEGGIKGEIVIVIDGPSEAEELNREADAEGLARARAAKLAAQGMRAKQISKQLTAEFGLPRNEAYQIALDAQKGASSAGAGRADVAGADTAGAGAAGADVPAASSPEGR